MYGCSTVVMRFVIWCLGSNSFKLWGRTNPVRLHSYHVTVAVRTWCACNMRLSTSAFRHAMHVANSDVLQFVLRSW
jgi:hypothetical protein